MTERDGVIFLWKLWLDIWEVFRQIVQILNVNVSLVIEELLSEYLDITVVLPFDFTLMELLATPLLILFIVLAVVACIKNIALDIIKPF